ncbi:hypothetical protein VTP01DRAFT_9285 [Rhizomucor pusillus]|uniref:uncharacterized protein n=1 Tax=Rhizomucor pusillus TaxID=4840 RepID=UPI0037430E17
MSAITLGSLTNSEYDDYLNRKLDQLEKQADAYGTLLASKRMNEQPLCDDPDCEYYEHRHRHRLPRRRGLRSSSSFKENQRRSWNTYYLPEEEEQVQYAGERRQHQQRIRRSGSENAGSNLYHEFEKNRPRWHRRRTTSIPAYTPASSFQHDWSFYADNSEHTTNTNDDDEDDESMNEMEILAAVNAERNIIGTAYRASLDDISVRPSSPTTEAPEQQYTLSPDGPTNTPAIAPMEPTPTNSQANSGSNTPAVATGAATGNNQRQQQQHQKKRRWWPLNYLFRRTPNSSTLTTPSPTSQGSLSSTTTQSASSSPSNNIKSIKTNGPLGDLLDPEQQEKIVDQLAVADPLVSEGTTTIPDNNEAIKIASLDRIWIFRLSEHPDSLWIVFDYANQHKLTQYTHQIYHNPGADQGVEFFDSHVHNGRLPVLVLPSRQCGYYPTNFTGEHIASLHVICIPNSSNLQFVYRQQHS